MRALSLITSAGALVLALALVAPALLGWQRYAIVSGSMSGSYDRGSLVFDEVVPVGRLRVGDVITYRPPTADHLRQGPLSAWQCWRHVRHPLRGPRPQGLHHTRPAGAPERDHRRDGARAGGGRRARQ